MKCGRFILENLKSIKRIVLIIIFFVMASNGFAQEFYLTCPGAIFIDDSQLTINEAGEDLDVVLQTSTDVYLNVTSDNFWNLKNEKWRIYVHKSDVEWNDELDLQIKRSGKGSLEGKGKPVLRDGNGWQSIGNVPNYWFRGKDKVNNIPINFRIMNVSLSMGARDFETDLILTVYDD